MSEIGEQVLVHCVEELGDGCKVLDTHLAGEPLKVTVGSAMFPPLVERALFEMLPGEKRTIALSPEQAYGSYDEVLVQHVPVQLLPDAGSLPIGGRIQLKTRMGVLDARVVSIGADEVVLDCNHEYAGKSATFEIELISIVRESAIDRELHPAGCACGCHKLKEQLQTE